MIEERMMPVEGGWWEVVMWLEDVPDESGCQ